MVDGFLVNGLEDLLNKFSTQSVLFALSDHLVKDLIPALTLQNGQVLGFFHLPYLVCHLHPARQDVEQLSVGNIDPRPQTVQFIDVITAF